MTAPRAWTAGERRVGAVTAVVLLGTACAFRLYRLSSVPGISGDEGWWGVQALAWIAGRPYEQHTTSGNPIDMIFLVPIALLHAIWRPSFLLLRTVPAAANLLALPVAFYFVRRAFGPATGWTFTVLLAVLPTAIAHARICQDPSQTVFWTGLVIYPGLVAWSEPARAGRWLSLALVMFPIALWTHPTNVFVAPFLLLPLVTIVRPLVPESRRARRLLLAGAGLLVLAGLAAASYALNYLGGSDQHLDKPWLAVAAHRFSSPAQWFELAANTSRLFNGVTVYHYFSGARPYTPPFDAAFVLCAAAAACGLLRRRATLDTALLLAAAGTWLLFFAFAGPDAMRPHFERWALCLIVPGALVLAAGAGVWLESPHSRRGALAACAVVAIGLLVTFDANYFDEFATSGGRSHLTYITAPVEPKKQALERIIAEAPGNEPVLVVAQQWWLVLPISYLAHNHPQVLVTTELAKDERDQTLQNAVGRGRLFFVEFAGTPAVAERLALVQSRGWHATPRTIQDAGGRDLIVTLEVTGPAR